MHEIIIDGVTIDAKTAVERYKSKKGISNLTDRHAKIFEEKFGVNDGRFKQWTEVGLKFGISKERARQLCALVLHKIGLLS